MPLATRFTSRLALAVAAALVALVGAEVAWRMFRTPLLSPTTNPRYVVPDEGLGWRYRPGGFRHVAEDFDVAVDINGQGFRDATFDLEAAAPRIITLGDSITFGWGVEAAAAFASKLEALTGATVFNLGVSGYGTDQELLLWRAWGPRLDPDVVVVTVCENDVEEVSSRVMYGKAKPYFDWDGDRLVPDEMPLTLSPLEEWSYLYRSLLKQRWLRARVELEGEALRAGRTRVVALLGALRREVREAGAELVVVAWESPWLMPHLEQFASDHDLPFLDGAAVLRRAASSGPAIFAGDPHWNARGHEAVARALADLLAKRGLLGPGG